MKPAETLGRLLRRWYIVVPGLMLAAIAAVGAWNFVGPEYERSGTQMLLPGEGNLPEGVTNPFLFIGGLALPADVIVQSVNGQGALTDVLADHPGAEVVIQRAPGSAPVIKTTVTYPDDVGAARALQQVMAHTVATLEELQSTEGVALDSRIEIATLTVDNESTLLQRTRMVVAAVVGFGVVVVVLIFAALIDGSVRRRPRRTRRRIRPSTDAADPAESPSDQTQSMIDATESTVDEPGLNDSETKTVAR